MIFNNFEPIFKNVHDAVKDDESFPISIEAIVEVIINNKHVDIINFIESPDFEKVNGALRLFKRPKIHKGIDHTSGVITAEVFYAQDLNQPFANYCWQRFTKAKELAHLIIDEADSRATEVETIRNLTLVVSRSSSGAFFKNRKVMDSEFWAELAAIEMLCPIRWRQAFTINIANGKYPTAYRNISEMFRIPEHYIRSILHPDIHNQIFELVFQNHPDRFQKLYTDWKVFYESSFTA